MPLPTRLTASPRSRSSRIALYVALTRTTRRLGLISPGEMPGDLKAILDQSPAHVGTARPATKAADAVGNGPLAQVQ